MIVVIWFYFIPDLYAVMPPLEQFMEMPSMDRRELFFRDIERGDIVIGRISSIREFGFFMVLICLGSGIVRDISHLEITVSHSTLIPCKNYVLIQVCLHLPGRILGGEG
jgi:hypothetical protein